MTKKNDQTVENELLRNLLCVKTLKPDCTGLRETVVMFFRVLETHCYTQFLLKLNVINL